MGYIPPSIPPLRITHVEANPDGTYSACYLYDPDKALTCRYCGIKEIAANPARCGCCGAPR